MGTRLHPDEALFPGERPFPIIPACDHYAGTEKTMRRALELQAEKGPALDVTLDLEDGAPRGREAEQAELVADLLHDPANRHGMVGVRIHDHGSPWWRSDVDTLVKRAGRRIGHITIPKATTARQVAEMITTVQNACAFAEVEREIPIHVLIETHGALQDVFKIAALPWMRGLDFGLMDFVSGHHGAIPNSAMRSPGQFEHALIRRAKSLICAAALAHGIVPAHNVTLELKDPALVRADAERARDEYGFQRMWSIHPDQVDPIVAAFTPGEQSVALAGDVLLAGQAADWAPVRHDDMLHDRASYRYHWQVLRRAHAGGRALPDAVRAAFFDGAA